MNAEASEYISSLKEKNKNLEMENIRLRERTGSLEKEAKYLKEQLEALAQRLYGRRSERFEDPNQKTLFDYIDWPEGSPEKEPEQEEFEKVEYKRRRRKKRGPKPLPKNLPRDRVNLDPPEEDRICACCNKSMERVGEKVTEELEVKPPEFRVKQLVQGEWACPDCMNGSIKVPLPPRPIEKGRPSPALLAYIIVSKYADHLPIYRQEQIFKRYGIELSRKTIDGWLGHLSGLLRPIVQSMRKWLLALSFLQSDDTLIQALDRELKGKSRRCYLWAYGIPAGEVVYHFTKSRSHKEPLEFLEGFSGHLQTDGFPGYNALYRTGWVEHIACLAHIRRKFFEAQRAAPDRVKEILNLIKKPYAIEEEARERGIHGQDLVSLREEKIRPLLEEIEGKIKTLAPLTTPKSKLGRAVAYARSQWPALLRYIKVPEAQLDNNWCENSLRPIVLGRKYVDRFAMGSWSVTELNNAIVGRREELSSVAWCA